MKRGPAFVRTWKVGTYTVTLTVRSIPKPGGAITAYSEWAPSMPRSMSEIEVQQYIAGRDRAVKDLAALLGIPVSELDGRP